MAWKQSHNKAMRHNPTTPKSKFPFLLCKANGLKASLAFPQVCAASLTAPECLWLQSSI